MPGTLVLPKNYRPLLDLKQTEKAIKLLKDFFEANLSAELALSRVTAPLFVLRGTGVNDDLNGIEPPVSFGVPDLGGAEVEVVQSLAKWKRMALADYAFMPGYGIYTDMNAIRPSEGLDNLHSLYVDQWDWERVITRDERHLGFLKDVVRRIYAAMKRTEFLIVDHYPQIQPVLPRDITFVHSEDLLAAYPEFSPREREDAVTREHGAVFVIGIGGVLADGKIHDGRAPDYDDWSTESAAGKKGLNGDIFVWNEVLGRSFELSSMGIRVDAESMLRQLEIRGLAARRDLYWHQRLLAGEFPLSIGGGIGQSRLCMYLLRKAHVGEIQASLWPQDQIEACRDAGITLL
ncbi:MAG: aspartate--ammonia ligase [Polyangiaceae bacterium]|nr:aspartate--ammonia ligase [Polyangiaceae bacterium]